MASIASSMRFGHIFQLPWLQASFTRMRKHPGYASNGVPVSMFSILQLPNKVLAWRSMSSCVVTPTGHEELLRVNDRRRFYANFSPANIPTADLTDRHTSMHRVRGGGVGAWYVYNDYVLFWST